MRKKLLTLLLLLSALPAAAQFYTDGEDPAAVRWWSRDTEHYRIIYPEGLNAVALEFAGELEKCRPYVGLSTGLTPGQAYKKRTPVVLHPFYTHANASVTWTPRRMDFYTIPDAYDPEPFPWIRSLAVHESRHLAQMQFGYQRVFKPFGWFLGEMFPGAMAGVYPGPVLLEGDAVVAETALSPFGRGRNGDFLSYYHIAFDQGDLRNWHKWRWGSYRHYAPDHYALGYMTLAGVRVRYDDPLFMARYFDAVARRPWRIGNLQREVKAVSGKRFRDSFSDIQADFLATWRKDDEARGPFTPYTLLTDVPSWYTDYGGLELRDDKLLAIRSGLLDAGSLVSIDSLGRERTLRPFATHYGGLFRGDDRIYWSESVPHPRWAKASTSRIRYLTPDGKIHNLTTRGRLFNPAAGERGIAVVDYPVEGGTAAVILDADGRETWRWQAPEGMQIAELEWAFGGLVATAITSGGTGLYLLKDGACQTLLSPQPVSIRSLSSEDEGLLMTCDRSGVNEIYLLDTNLALHQLTATRYGAGEGLFKGDTLIFTVYTAEGQMPARTTELLRRPVRWGDNYRYAVADRLSAQEAALREGNEAAQKPEVIHIDAPKRYRKVPHIPHVHSWAPLYINYDALSDFNVENIMQAASVGATAFFQNILGTASGSVAYAWKPDALGSGAWRHSGHLNLTYSGLFPVFNLTLDVGDRSALQYLRRSYVADGLRIEQVGYGLLGIPSVNFTFQTYVPLNFSSGGVQRGLTPRVSLSLSNDRYDKSTTEITYAEALEGSSFPILKGYVPGDYLPMNRLDLSLAGYILRSRGPSETYPHWGIGAQVGYRTRLGLSDLYSAAAFGYLYGYLPGIVRNHGTRLSALWQHSFGPGVVGAEGVANPAPRGLTDSMLAQAFAFSSSDQVKLTADYALPIWVGDISWFSPVAYITHFVLTPHVDYTFFSLSGTLDGGIGTAGFDFALKMPHLLWLPYDTELGFTFDWSFGPSAAQLRADNMIPQRPWYLGLIFNVSL